MTAPCKPPTYGCVAKAALEYWEGSDVQMGWWFHADYVFRKANAPWLFWCTVQWALFPAKQEQP